MKKYTVFGLVFLMLFSTFVVIGCGVDSTKEAEGSGEEVSKETTYIDIGGAGSGGRWFMEATAIAGLLSEKIPEVNASPRVVSTGGAGNIELMNEDKLEIGVACADECYSAFNGLSPYYEGKKQNVYLWYKQNPTLITILAHKDVQKIEDLRDAKIAVGLPGTVENIQVVEFLKLYGLEPGEDYTIFELGRDDSYTELIDGRVDAAILPVSRDNVNHQGRVLAARSNLHMISLDRQKAEEFIEKFPYFSIDDIGDPKLGYPDILRIATPMYRIINPELDEELVYKLTKTLWENVDEIYEELSWYELEGVTIENATSDVEIPFHPGAEKYYREVGVID